MINKIDRYYKDDIKIIKRFLDSRPKVSGCFCYGIGEQFGKKIYRLIILSSDIWKWQRLNCKKNESTEYINFLYTTGYRFVEYIGIKENNCIFDYTIMDEDEFIDDLTKWKYFTYAEIFQRPFITIKSNKIFDKYIMINQKNALTTSLLMLNDNNKCFFDIMLNLYCISGYLTNETITLVYENYDFLKDIYNEYDIITVNDNKNINIDIEKLKQEIKFLPNKVRNNVYEYKGLPRVSGISQYFEDKKIKEKDIINDMRYLVNGFFRTFDYNGRTSKAKLLIKE